MAERLFTDQQNEQKQRAYAQYLSNLPKARRNDALAKMKPALRETMQGFIAEAIAHRIREWNGDVSRAFLRQLRRQCPFEYQRVTDFLNKSEGFSHVSA